MSWYPDSGATDHLTADLNNLQVHSDYTGNDRVHIGDGTGLIINNIGHSSISTSKRNLHFKDVLHVPAITKNLLSVRKFTQDNNVFFEFHPILGSVSRIQSQRR